MGEYDPSLHERRNYPAYLEDYGAWILAQIELIRDGQFDELDIEHLLEEIEGLARSDFDAFKSAIRIVLIHMLKWDIQTDYRSRSWAVSIDGHRVRVAEALEESPSYKARIEEALAKAYRRARYDAAKETRLPLSSFPETCPFSFEEVMTRPHTFSLEEDDLT
jgi:predicted DNA-binding ribbon-helix-helix protein